MYRLPSDIPRTFYIKKEEATDPDHGCRPSERPTPELVEFGVINLDKPSGPTSHEVVAWVKKIFSIGKAGHGGTLDPRVTGVLPTALSRATRIVQTLLPAGKEYVCVMKLHKDQPEERVRKALELFVGPIYQRPPLKSSVSRVIRVRHIYYIDFLEYDPSARRALFKVGCEAGTYIRKLCYDVGEVLAVGASMEELRRTRVGPFREDEKLTTLQTLTDAVYFYREEGDDRLLRKCVQPMEFAVENYPKVVVRDSAVDAICHGANVTAPGLLQIDVDIKPKLPVAVMTLKGELVALGIALERAKSMLKKNNGIMIKTNRVFMPRGTYPQAWK
ncbi:MAG: RNA-guided pseudouridylation complex pseudouridine synthase subunit Cbf5 [Promethearchaeota archaeon]